MQPLEDDTLEKIHSYVKDMDINGTYVDMTEQLLMFRPENPIRFMIDYLSYKHKETVRVNDGVTVHTRPPTPPRNSSSCSHSVLPHSFPCATTNLFFCNFVCVIRFFFLPNVVDLIQIMNLKTNTHNTPPQPPIQHNR